MEISNDIRARIIDAADQLYQETNRERFPTVDQVRRAARADMNTTSAVMKEWRRQQTAAPAAVAVAIPERVQDAMSAALATVWSEAQELANESLTAAKQAWETERADADTMRAELADAYEQQAQELDACKQQLTEAQAENMAAEQRIEELQELHRQELAAVQQQRDAIAQELATVQARTEAQQEAAAEHQKAVQAQIDQLAAELEKSRHSAAEAREYAASLAGQMEAITAQNRELVAAIKGGISNDG